MVAGRCHKNWVMTSVGEGVISAPGDGFEAVIWGTEIKKSPTAITEAVLPVVFPSNSASISTNQYQYLRMELLQLLCLSTPYNAGNETREGEDLCAVRGRMCCLP
jgi:hypothetical protein